jgi:hypothetical protein
MEAIVDGKTLTARLAEAEETLARQARDLADLRAILCTALQFSELEHDYKAVKAALVVAGVLELADPDQPQVASSPRHLRLAWSS